MLFGRRKPAADADRLIEYGGFLVRMNKQMERLNVPADAPLPMKIATFLIFGSRIVRETAGYPPADQNINLREGAALLLVLQQGIHTFLQLAHGEGTEGSKAYKDEAAKIFTIVMARSFGYDHGSPDDKALGLLGFGGSVVKAAQRSNVPLLQSAFDAWDAFFIDDENAPALGQVYRQAVEWVKADMAA